MKEATTVYASEEDMKDLSSFIAKLHDRKMEREGIVKVIPPNSWKARENVSYDDVFKGKIAMNPIVQTLAESKYQKDKGIFQYFSEPWMQSEHGMKWVEDKNLTVQAHRVEKKVERSLKMSIQEYQTAAKHIANSDAKEQDFWKAAASGHVRGLYGADIDMTLMDDCAGNWNLSQLKKTTDLKVAGEQMTVRGIATSYVYVGYQFTFFPSHTENVDLYSINFNHYGEPKEWYGLPAHDAEKFEKFAGVTAEKMFSTCHGRWTHKPLIVDPNKLIKEGFEVTRIIQKPGEFVITFPRAYHWGYNHGFNVAEAGNFLIKYWLEFGLTAARCTCKGGDVEFPFYPFVKHFNDSQLIQLLLGKSLITVPTIGKMVATGLTDIDYLMIAEEAKKNREVEQQKLAKREIRKAKRRRQKERRNEKKMANQSLVTDQQQSDVLEDCIPAESATSPVFGTFKTLLINRSTRKTRENRKRRKIEKKRLLQFATESYE